MDDGRRPLLPNPRAALVALTALALATAGCSGQRGTTSLSLTVTEPAPGKVDLAGPARVRAGRVEVTLKNAGRQAHDAQLVRVDGSHPIEDVLAVFGGENTPIPEWVHAEGGVATVAPGRSQGATVILTPGQYYVIDTNTDADNTSFAAHGGVRTLAVTGHASAATLPSVDTTITAKEYRFGVPSALKAGTAAVRFENVGLELHMLVAAPLAPGATIDDVKRSLSSPTPAAAPPLDFARAVGAETIDPGKALVTRMTFTKGAYAFICFVNDRAGGPPHFALGMLQEVRVS